MDACIDSFQLPEWLDDYNRGFGLESPAIYPTVKQLRIFLESIIILAVMAGYREAIIKFFNYLFRLFKKPKPSLPKNSVLFVSRQAQ
uniref:Uncharacterized protein n=1 Tax=Panagrolaimus davidi TaxID=227884 RepID=A0A914QWH1_9BILA